MLNGDIPAEVMLGKLGLYIESLIRNQIIEMRDPPLHPFTKARRPKGEGDDYGRSSGDTPLAGKSEIKLKERITWRIV